MNGHAQLPNPAWYLVQCKPRQDARALEHLERQGFECFAPSIRVESLRGGRLRQAEQPMFPGYLFIRLGADDNWLSLRSTRGVSRIVGFSARPCEVPERIVEHLKSRCANPPPGVAFRPGERLQVRLGPYAEVEAIFLSMDGEERVMLLLSLLNREQLVPVPLANIQVLGEGRADIPIL